MTGRGLMFEHDVSTPAPVEPKTETSDIDMNNNSTSETEVQVKNSFQALRLIKSDFSLLILEFNIWPLSHSGQVSTTDHQPEQQRILGTVRVLRPDEIKQELADNTPNSDVVVKTEPDIEGNLSRDECSSCKKYKTELKAVEKKLKVNDVYYHFLTIHIYIYQHILI